MAFIYGPGGQPIPILPGQVPLVPMQQVPQPPPQQQTRAFQQPAMPPQRQPEYMSEDKLQEKGRSRLSIKYCGRLCFYDSITGQCSPRMPKVMSSIPDHRRFHTVQIHA